MIKKFTLFVALLLTVSLLLTACGGAATEASGCAEAPGVTPTRIP